ncbi:YlmH family RNA-binding protein [Virgibacillus sediminis]|uniref:RNA-binding protein n=1 Tax=Virgibacillus sediminis TaxID=202260 RepID=A0ABV7ABC7_9BACI
MEIYQHFRKEEQPFIDQALSWKEQVEKVFVPKLTDFLDPRELQILETIIGAQNEEVKLYANGGGMHAERKRAIIAPFYEEVSAADYQLTLLQAEYPSKFVTLSHRDVMGACMSLGLKRKKIGDMLVDNGIIQIVAADEVAPYILANLTEVKKAKVRLEEKPFTYLLEEEKEWEESDKTVSSLRLDAVLKEIYHISRKDAAEFISRQQVKVNFRVVDDSKFILQEGDLLSLRGKGRSKLAAVNGRTKKDKWKITIAVLK